MTKELLNICKDIEEAASGLTEAYNKISSKIQMALGRVLIVDDSSYVLDIVSRAINHHAELRNSIETCDSVDAAYKAVQDKDIKVAVLDYWLDHGTSEGLALELMNRGVKVIMVTCDATNDVKKFCEGNHIDLYLKPISLPDLYGKIKAALVEA